MIEYPKIQTLFLRDEKNIIIPSKFTCPEFEYLKNIKWECTEKIDGTNMSVQLVPTVESSGNVTWNMSINGRTERANIPISLLTKMQEIFTMDKIKEVLHLAEHDYEDPAPIIIYGEGYGKKIQACGGRYLKEDVNFILFDIKIGNWWLTREACQEIANGFGIDTVPLIDYMTIPEAIEYVKKGFKSEIAEDTTLDAEGLVLKTVYGLKNRMGDRLITKIKTCDFNKLKATYGNDSSIK